MIHVLANCGIHAVHHAKMSLSVSRNMALTLVSTFEHHKNDLFTHGDMIYMFLRKKTSTEEGREGTLS